MNRRTFLGKAGGGVVALSALGWLGSGQIMEASQPRNQPKNWIWTGGGGHLKAEEQKRRLEQFKEAGVEALLLSDINDEVLSQAKGLGLETHAWIWTLLRGDKTLLKDHPDWYVVSRLGVSAATKPPYVDYYHFLCPSHEQVGDYLTKVVSDLADKANLDGIHLDYIRYPDVILPVALWKQYHLVQNKELPQFDFCYCEVCRNAFKKQTGEDPLKISDPPANAAWRQYRYDSVTRLVNRLADTVHAKRKKITAAVFPTPSLAKKLVRQDWAKWNLDAVLPMTYHNFYKETTAWIERAVREGVAALPATRPLYAGLYLPALKGDEFDQAVKFAMAGGARGVSLFGGLRQIRPA